MLSLTYQPPYPLSRFVETFWYGEHAPGHLFERYLPTGDVDLVLNLHDATLRIYDAADLPHPQRFTGPIVSGAHSRYYVIDTLQQASLLGVKFRPGGAYPFLGESPGRLQNQHVALKDLWGRPAIELQARLMEAATPDARFRCLEQALLDRLPGMHRPHPAVASAVSTFVAQEGVSSVTAVARASGFSARGFIELFRREVGLPPKVFCRLLRFQRVLRLANSGSFPGFAELALDCGYYDQAHLIRDFKDFTGLTPGAYLACRGAYDNHVPVVGPGQIYPIPAQTVPAE
jgi:AraC-like DNA-binding protein